MSNASSTRFPKLIVFDLDYTLWPLWVDTHVTPPLKRKGSEINKIYDRYNKEMKFYKDVPAILIDSYNRDDSKLAVASRTSASKEARQALTELLIPGSKARSSDLLSLNKESASGSMSSINCFDFLEIYPGSKLAHFKQIFNKSEIPYSEMVFFDDEPRNEEVKKLGVTFVLVKNGLDKTTFEAGIEAWRRLNVVDDP